jgi:hypothetical protein
MTQWIGAMLPLVVAASVPATTANAPAPYPLTERNKADIVRQIKDKLGHGDTALWRWPLHQRKYGLYCGWVNAQNFFGEYTGWKPFMVIGGVSSASDSTGEFTVHVSEIESGGPSIDAAYIIASMCPKNGYDLSGPPPE